MRAFVRLWDEITRERYGVAGRQAAPVPLRRPGQLARPDRGAAREQRPAHRAGDARRSRCRKDARARAVQLPAWNEALGLPRPWDQQWSLRMQQVLAFESDLLEYDDLFDGSHVVEAKVAELIARRAGRDRPRPGDGRRGRGRRVRLHEVGAGRVALAPRRAPDRVRRGHRRRRQRVHRDRAQPAAGRPRRRDPDGRPGGRGRGDRALEAWRGRARRRRRRRGARRVCGTRPRPTPTSCRRRSRARGPA